MSKIFNRVNHSEERDIIRRLSSDEVKKHITNALHMTVSETTGRPGLFHR
jgi:hypothetical protein